MRPLHQLCRSTGRRVLGSEAALGEVTSLPFSMWDAGDRPAILRNVSFCDHDTAAYTSVPGDSIELCFLDEVSGLFSSSCALPLRLLRRHAFDVDFYSLHIRDDSQ